MGDAWHVKFSDAEQKAGQSAEHSCVADPHARAVWRNVTIALQRSCKVQGQKCHSRGKRSAEAAVSQHPAAAEKKIISTTFIALPMLEIIPHTHTRTCTQSNCNVCLVARGVSFSAGCESADLNMTSKHVLNCSGFARPLPLPSSSRVRSLALHGDGLKSDPRESKMVAHSFSPVEHVQYELPSRLWNYLANPAASSQL